MNRSRILVGILGLGMLGTVVLGLRAADEPATKNPAPSVSKEQLTLQEQLLRDQFQDFQTSILKLKQRLERGGTREDIDRAKTLDKILQKVRDDGISTQFERLVENINKTNFKNFSDVNILVQDSQRLAKNLREIIEMYNLSDSSNKITEERKKIEEILKNINQAIRDQQITQIQTEIAKTARNELERMQKEVANKVNNINRDLNGLGKEGKDNKGASKENKGGKSGESKDAGKGGESKGDAKEGQGGDKNKPSEAKGGEGKSGKDGQPSEAKGKGGEGKDGEAKGSKGGEGAGEKKGNEGGDKKEGGAKGDGEQGGNKEKPGEAKPGEKAGSPAESKSGKGADGKGGEGKPGKPGEGKAGEGKAGGKGGEGKPGEGKAGGQSQGQSEAKPGGDQGAQKQDPSQPQSSQPQDVTDAKKKVQDADYSANQAAKKIPLNPKDATPDQADTINKLEDAKKKLENLLRQLREEELERLLAALEARCNKMLAMQIEVYDGTVAVQKGVNKTADKKPTREHKIEANRLEDKEKDIVLEASKAIEMLEAEGSAVAFPEVFQQVREDMKHVQRRLGITDTADVTQAIERDIIDTLKEMIDALKKAQQEIQDKKNPKSGNPPPPNPNADQKLLDQIAELKMIRSLQIKLNTRTQTYGRMYPGEQAKEGNIRREVIQLGDRQERIFDITNRIAKGDNK